MSQASPELVWQVIKKGNCFLRKGSNGRKDPIFSAEKGNLYARHSFKFSGAAAASRLALPGACDRHAGLAAVSRGVRGPLASRRGCSGCNPRQRVCRLAGR